MAKIGEINLTRPLANMTVTIRLSPEFRIRLWIAVQLAHLAVWVAGGEFETEAP